MKSILFWLVIFGLNAVAFAEFNGFIFWITALVSYFLALQYALEKATEDQGVKYLWFIAFSTNGGVDNTYISMPVKEIGINDLVSIEDHISREHGHPWVAVVNFKLIGRVSDG